MTPPHEIIGINGTIQTLGPHDTLIVQLPEGAHGGDKMDHWLTERGIRHLVFVGVTLAIHRGRPPVPADPPGPVAWDEANHEWVSFPKDGG